MKYQLSRAADADLERIVEFSIDRFGEMEARKYYDGLARQLDELAENPLRYPAIDHICRGYRRCIYGSHAIYYLQKEPQVLIVRILNTQDIHTALSKDPL